MPSHKFKVSDEELVAFKKRRYARGLAASAIKKGDIVKPFCCELCSTKDKNLHAHHIDYGRPYFVTWLCVKCHGLAHRKDHVLNPDNNVQSPMPMAMQRYQKVSITFTLPVENFIAMQRECEKRCKTMAELMREEAFKQFPLEKRQLELNFKEMDDDQPQNVQHPRIQSLGEDESRMPEQKTTVIQKVRSKRNLNLQGVDGKLLKFPVGHGTHANNLQRHCTVG